MFIELFDLFRCPVEHEESWLVAAFTRMEERFVIKGKLGCPVCSATYPIVDGVARFSDSAGPATDDFPGIREEETVRLAALLALTRPGRTVVIEGPASLVAPALAGMTESRIIVMNPAARMEEVERVALVTAGERLPLPAASVDGLVLGTATNARISEALRVLKPGGRFVAPAHVNAGAGYRELARDDRNMVAESVGPLVGLSR